MTQARDLASTNEQEFNQSNKNFGFEAYALNDHKAGGRITDVGR